MNVDGMIGMTYNPLRKIYALGRDMDVNYMLLVERPAPVTSNAPAVDAGAV